MTTNFRGFPLDRPMVIVDPSEFGTFPEGTLAWQWENGDNDDPDWYPQGITSFERDGQRLALISWYSKRGEDARISYVTRRPDVNGEYWYGHAQLSGDHAESHAGGLAFRHSALWVAITRYGVASFDATHPREDDGQYFIDNLDGCNLVDDIDDPKKRFVSCTDVDWADGGKTLLTGVYSTFGAPDRLPAAFTWPLNADGPDPDGTEHLGIDEPGSDYSNLQGVTKYGDTWYFSQSGRFTQIRRSEGIGKLEHVATCDKGLEDLHITSSGRYLLGLTEKLGNRIVFQIDLNGL